MSQDRKDSEVYADTLVSIYQSLLNKYFFAREGGVRIHTWEEARKLALEELSKMLNIPYEEAMNIVDERRKVIMKTGLKERAAKRRAERMNSNATAETKSPVVTVTDNQQVPILRAKTRLEIMERYGIKEITVKDLRFTSPLYTLAYNDIRRAKANSEIIFSFTDDENATMMKDIIEHFRMTFAGGDSIITYTKTGLDVIVTKKPQK